MKELVCKYQPFDLTQTVSIYEDGKIKSNIKIETGNFNEQILKIIRAEQINCIYFKGHKKFSQGIKDQIKRYEKAHYCSDKLIIKII